MAIDQFLALAAITYAAAGAVGTISKSKYIIAISSYRLQYLYGKVDRHALLLGYLTILILSLIAWPFMTFNQEIPVKKKQFDDLGVPETEDELEEECTDLEEEEVVPDIDLRGRSLVSIADLTAPELDYVFNVAKAAKKLWETDRNALKVLDGKVLSCLFYEPSTRTSSSFIAAMQGLGGTVIPITQGVTYSSVSKGETLQDTVRTLAQYSDAIVLRHPKKGAALVAQQALILDKVPLINAGDGIGEHPTQALTDLYTIVERMGDPSGKAIAFVGDLKNGRTVHSLLRLLWCYPNMTFYFVSPKNMGLPPDLMNAAKDLAKIFVVDKLPTILDKVDIVYMTRVQKERLTITEKMVSALMDNTYTLNSNNIKLLRPNAIIMHPMPRLDELSTDIDSDPRAAYFQQVLNGMFVRMALLACIMGVEQSLLDNSGCAWDDYYSKRYDNFCEMSTEE